MQKKKNDETKGGGVTRKRGGEIVEAQSTLAYSGLRKGEETIKKRDFKRKLLLNPAGRRQTSLKPNTKGNKIKGKPQDLIQKQVLPGGYIRQQKEERKSTKGAIGVPKDDVTLITVRSRLPCKRRCIRCGQKTMQIKTDWGGGHAENSETEGGCSKKIEKLTRNNMD